MRWMKAHPWPCWRSDGNCLLQRSKLTLDTLDLLDILRICELLCFVLKGLLRLLDALATLCVPVLDPREVANSAVSTACLA